MGRTAKAEDPRISQLRSSSGTAPALRHLARRSWSERTSSLEEPTMLHWAAVFLVIALIAALFGFGGIAAGAASIAKVLFVLFIILALVAFVVGRRAPI
jgi:uncharacterized membrane protein YtjA (UPF0391 family)